MTNHAHILLRSGTHGLSRFMRRFLTGHAIAYNRRHKRHGHPSRGGSPTFPEPLPQLNNHRFKIPCRTLP